MRQLLESKDIVTWVKGWANEFNICCLCIAHKVGKREVNVFCWGNVMRYVIQLYRNIQLELVDDILA